MTVIVTPTSFIGRDFPPYNNFILTCVASKPSNVLPALVIVWYFNGKQLNNSLDVSISELDMNNQKSSMLSVNSADVNTSGSYKCIASISPPESQLVHDTEEITVLIKG